MRKILSIVIALLLAGCEEQGVQEQAFYQWKTKFRPSRTEQEALSETKRLFIRYFDVVVENDGIQPAATVVFGDSFPQGMSITPVVFIVNKALEITPEDNIVALSEKICTRISLINQKRNITNISEIQIDCDWNISTREKYFLLLRSLRKMPCMDGKQLSVTLRLHQWKYSRSTGVPPADRVMLMCYNMGRLTEYGSRNSILDTEELNAYVQHVGAYPLPMDVALPLFHWGVCFDNHRQYRGLVNGLCEEDMRKPYFEETEPFLYRSDTTFLLRGFYVRRGDYIRLEEPSPNDIRKAADMLAEHIPSPRLVVWYHLDSLLLQKFRKDVRRDIAERLRN
ncbi:MAG: hypothetical protein LBS09_02260 [Bacteroidales bacterium]|jgi:uncharacterized repeat protein (TIGR01451 family)|nr:hypothetical protein [Bacteroidales bacterium]